VAENRKAHLGFLPQKNTSLSQKVSLYRFNLMAQLIVKRCQLVLKALMMNLKSLRPGKMDSRKKKQM
jgi:hypothetical protein